MAIALVVLYSSTLNKTLDIWKKKLENGIKARVMLARTYSPKKIGHIERTADFIITSKNNNNTIAGKKNTSLAKGQWKIEEEKNTNILTIWRRWKKWARIRTSEENHWPSWSIMLIYTYNADISKIFEYFIVYCTIYKPKLETYSIIWHHM